MVIGISGDTPETLALFKKKEKLNYTLVADPKGTIADTLGVPHRKGGTIKKKIFGKEHSLTRGVSIARWNVVIGKDGNIELIGPVKNAGKNAKDILKVIN